jgi:probable F420-dependent oxidoreductase
MKVTINLPGLSLYPGTGKHWWEQITSEQLVEIARRCEELGFDYIKISDHLAMNHESTPEMGARWVHSLAAAGFVLGATSRIKVVPLVVVPYHQPVELAKALSTLDFVSGGRLTPLLLVGYKPWEFELVRAPYEERGRAMDEYVDAMRELWSAENPIYHGKFVSFDDVVFEPKPVQDPLPLWFGGRTKAALRRISRVGDGWVSYATPRSQFAELLGYIREQPTFEEHPRRLEAWIELFEGKRDPDSHAVVEQAKVVLERDAIIDQVHEIAAVGATMTSLDDIIGTGKFQNGQPGAPPPSRNIGHFLERLQWAAEEILPELHATEPPAQQGVA